MADDKIEGSLRTSTALKIITDRDIITNEHEIDGDLTAVINNETGGLLSDIREAVPKRYAKEITQELIVKLNDKANKIGYAYVVKRVLHEKKSLVSAMLHLARGMSVERTVRKEYYDSQGKLFKADVTITSEDIAPNFNAGKWLIEHINGKNPIAVGKMESKSFDEFLKETLNEDQELRQNQGTVQEAEN